MIFSLCLPLYLFLGRIMRRFGLVGLLVPVGLVAAGHHWQLSFLFFLAMFGLGVVLAFQLDSLIKLAERFRRSRRRKILGIAAAGMVTMLLSGVWLERLLRGVDTGAGFVAALLGGVVLVAVTAALGASSATPIPVGVAWLGSRSFSLYLVHEPIAVSMALVLGDRLNVVTILATTVPVAFLVTECFYRSVEQPSLRVATYAGGLLQRLKLGAVPAHSSRGVRAERHLVVSGNESGGRRPVATELESLTPRSGSAGRRR